MIEGVIASLLAMGIGYGIESACKKFDLNGTLKSDFNQAFNQAIKKWTVNEKAREKFKRKKYIFEELINVGYNRKSIEELDNETKSLLVEFNNAVCEYENLSRHIQQILLKKLVEIVENIGNLYFTPESYLNLDKYNNKTKKVLESEIPTIFYRRRFILEESILGEEKKFYDEDLDIDSLQGKKNLFYGEGGLGKSTFLKKIGNLFLEDTLNFCVYFDAKKYDSTALESLKFESDKLSNYLYYLGKCFENDLRAVELDTFLQPKENEIYTKYLILDGINEIPTNQERKEILNLLDTIYSKFKITIICSSRYKDGFNYNSWQRFKSKLISNDELKRIISEYSNHDFETLNNKNRSYLRIPFFLDKAIKYNDFVIESYSAFIEKHLLNSVKVGSQKNLILEELSNIAFNAYKEKNISNIPIVKIPSSLKVDYLVEKNIIYISDKEKQHFNFEHQLIVDLLTSNILSKNPELWNKDTFDIITYDSNSSWEIMQMILEQVETKELGTNFLLNLYNWNYYAVLWCLKFVEKTKFNYIDAIAILLIVAEKLFDKFRHTKETVERYLKDLLIKFEIKGIKDGIINEIDYISFLNLNIGLFKDDIEYKVFFDEMVSTKKLNFGIIEKIVKEQNPAKAWGYSNMFKRCVLTKENETQLKAYFLNADKLVQWRIVHSLGIAKQKDSISFLLDKIESDEYPWVSYGALRSIIEIYYNSTSKTEIIKKLLTQNILRKILNNTSLSRELRNCLTYPPKDKKDIVKNYFEQIIKDDSNIFDDKIGEKEEWEKAYIKFESQWN